MARLRVYRMARALKTLDRRLRWLLDAAESPQRVYVGPERRRRQEEGAAEIRELRAIIARGLGK
jgi:hypothetical protein